MIILRQKHYTTTPNTSTTQNPTQTSTTTNSTTGGGFGSKLSNMWGNAKDTWSGMNNTQKGLVIGGGVALTGATAMALKNRKERKEAEEKLELERARRQGIITMIIIRQKKFGIGDGNTNVPGTPAGGIGSMRPDSIKAVAGQGPIKPAGAGGGILSSLLKK